MLEIIKTRIGVITYLAPIGLFSDEDDLNTLKGTIDSCIDSHESHLVIDLAKVPTITGAGLELMLDIQDQLSRRGGELKVVNANGMLKDIFLITGFDNYVAVITTASDL